MKINENYLRNIIRESLFNIIKEADGDVQKDEYGNPIPRGGQGWQYTDDDKKDPTFSNRQGYNQDGSKGPWFSRSCAMATAVILKDRNTGETYVLAGQRGSGTPDYQGYWNLPCGYLDYHETTKQGAAREVYEETGIQVNPEQMYSFGYSSDPSQNRQNVCFYFAAVLTGIIEDYPFSLANMEENEVSGLQWVKLEDVNNVMWAFGHKQLIDNIMSKLGFSLNDESGYSAYSIIDRAINLLRQGSDPQQIIQLLQNAKEQLDTE